MKRYILINNKVPYLKTLTNEFSELFKSHYSKLQKRKFDDKLLSYSINSFLANSLYLIHCKSTVGILPMNRNKYADLIVNGHKSKFKGSYHYSNLFWEMLEDLNYIRIDRCQRSYSKVGRSYVTILEPMVAYLTPYLVNLRLLPLSNCILLRDKYKNVIPYKKNKDISESISKINAYNKLLLSTSVVEPINGYEYTLQFHRIYNGDFFHGGRFYEVQGSVQCMSSLSRCNLLLNGQETVEVDFKSLHPRIIYAVLGIELPDDFDPYAISPDNFELPDTPEIRQQLRNLSKIGLLILINASNPYQALGALETEFKEAKIAYDFDLLPDDLSMSTVISALKEINPEIAEKFHSGAGLLLQNYDSNIAELVISYFTEKGIPVIPIHDSFIVSNEFEQEMHVIMKEAYECVVGSTLNCIVETK